MQWLCNICVIFNEFTIVVSEASEAMNVSYSLWNRPLHNDFDLLRISSNTCLRNNVN